MLLTNWTSRHARFDSPGMAINRKLINAGSQQEPLLIASQTAAAAPAARVAETAAIVMVTPVMPPCNAPGMTIVAAIMLSGRYSHRYQSGR